MGQDASAPSFGNSNISTHGTTEMQGDNRGLAVPFSRSTSRVHVVLDNVCYTELSLVNYAKYSPMDDKYFVLRLALGVICDLLVNFATFISLEYKLVKL